MKEQKLLYVWLRKTNCITLWLKVRYIVYLNLEFKDVHMYVQQLCMYHASGWDTGVMPTAVCMLDTGYRCILCIVHDITQLYLVLLVCLAPQTRLSPLHEIFNFMKGWC